MNENKQKFRKNVGLSLVVLLVVMVMTGLFSTVGAHAQEAPGAAVAVPPVTAERASVMQWGLIAAAVAFGFGAIGAGFAIAHVGAAAMGAIGEKPEIAGQALIFIALAEGLVVFGFITALMILGKI